MSNYDLIGRALGLLRDGAAPYVAREIHAAVKDNRVNLDIIKRYVENPNLNQKPIDQWDVSPLMRIMRESWNEVFRAALSWSERNLVHEVSDIRNAWAHQSQFSDDDTDRALDSMQRLLTAMSAEQAEAVGRIKTDLRAKLLGTGKGSERPPGEGQATVIARLAMTPPHRPVNALPSKDEFMRAVRALLREAELEGKPFLEINSGQLHRDLGGYPGTRHALPSCCDAMYEVQKSGDAILSKPPKGKGASLTIRYRLPR